MNVKVMGYLRCAQAVAPYMVDQGWGRIINLSGMAARQAGYSVGSMRNVSVSALSKNLADELGPQGINVTTVHPGMTYTERIPDMLADRAKTQGITVEEAERQMAEGNSIHHIVDAREVAYVVAFLASPKSISQVHLHQRRCHCGRWRSWASHSLLARAKISESGKGSGRFSRRIGVSIVRTIVR
jgi:NAD(P)-dependent dehydrogenase (short-subunit alcohol dehydrogenase family)